MFILLDIILDFSLCFFLFFLINVLYLLIAAVFSQIFHPIVGLTKPTVTPTNETNAEIEMQPLTAETKTRKFSK